MKKYKKKTVLGFAWIIFSGIVLVSTAIPPSSFWPAYFLSLLLLPVMLLNIITLFYFLIRQKWSKVIVSVLFLAFCYPFIKSTYVASSATQHTTSSTKIKILSYNASFFNISPVFSKSYYTPELQQKGIFMKDWLTKNDADIKCVQEFFNDENSDIFNTLESISKDGEYDHRFLSNPNPIHKNGTKRGIIIFSKYPIIDSGELFLSNNLYNSSSYVDVLVNSDTIRVINTHLQSMNLKAKGSLREKLSKIKNSAIRRETQLNMIKEFVEQSPYETILCGDFNEIPYTYSYGLIKDRIANSFEDVGNGFGFTYTGRLFFFLRIDHQFHTRDLLPTKFVVYKDNYMSAHYPIECEYVLSGESSINTTTY